MESEHYSHYLSVMGVEQWRLRAEPEAQPKSESKPLLGHGYFFRWDRNQQCLIGLTHEHLEAERELFDAICKALGSISTVSDYTNLDALIEAWQTARRVVVLGEMPPSLMHDRVVCTYSLADMLAEPKTKAAVWQLLKRK